MTISKNKQNGYSLIEVLVAMTLTGIGLLGVGLLVSASLQRSQSSEQLGVATDFAQNGLDIMRANRLGAFRMTGTSAGASACNTAESSSPTPEQRRARWDCAFSRAIPNATAVWSYSEGVANVEIVWRRDRGNEEETTINFETRL